jgi:Domain of unknown function (DUF5615)
VKIKIDENLPDDLALLLRAAEYDVATVEEEGLAGYDDPPVLKAATAEDRILLCLCLSEGRGMRKGGLEPPRVLPHRILNPARLPIPPLSQTTRQDAGSMKRALR